MSRKIVSVSLPEDLAKRLEKIASDSNTGKSGLVREALEVELRLRDWKGFQKKAMRAAAERGIGPEDVEQLINEVRAERSQAAARTA